MPAPSFSVQSIDHVVLTVASIQATVDFYTTHLGMTHEKFKAGDGVER
jgi:catechol 2,3-dioxygenase-like lactoylglutathione lyase family enzyme